MDTQISNEPLIKEGLDVDPVLLEELVKAGVLYGRKKSKTNPRMRKYIFATRNGFEIIDIAQTMGLIDKAAEFLKTVAARKGLILFVGTDSAARDALKATAQELNYPHVSERWLGGTLTNFKTLNKRIQYFIKLKSDRDLGKLEKYTKKERFEFDKEIEKLTHLFGGLEIMDRLPEAVVVIGVGSQNTAVREARRLKIPIVGFLSSDSDPDLVQYPIPGNDRARSSIVWVLSKLKEAIKQGQKGVGKEEAVKAAENKLE